MVHSDADLTWRLSLSLADGGRGENGPSHYISSGMSVWEKNPCRCYNCCAPCKPLTSCINVMQLTLSGMPSTVLDRLRAGEVIIGDGSYVFTLERRGYVQAGEL